MSDAHFLDAADANVRAAWADLLACSDQATPFSTLEYADAVRDVLGIDYRLAGIWSGEQLSAGVLLFERRRGPYRTVVVPPATPYTTFLFDAPLRETDINQRRSTLDALLAFLDEHYHALAFHLHPSLTDVRTFQWSGYEVQPLYTHRAPLADEDELLSRFSKGTRKRFLQDLEDYQVGPAPIRIAETAALITASYERNGRKPPIPDEQLAELASYLQRHSSLLSHYTARPLDDHQSEGGQLFLKDETTLFMWLGASERGPAMTLMIVQALLDFHAGGLIAYDHVGANTPPIAEFKRSFGAPLVTYYRAVRTRRPELRLFRSLRRLLAS